MRKTRIIVKRWLHATEAAKKSCPIISNEAWGTVISTSASGLMSMRCPIYSACALHRRPIRVIAWRTALIVSSGWEGGSSEPLIGLQQTERRAALENRAPSKSDHAPGLLLLTR